MSVIRARPEDKWPRLFPISEEELDNPTVFTVLKLIWNSFARLFHDSIGMILGSAFLVIMLWGTHGSLELVDVVWPGWDGPGSDPDARATIIPGIAWDQEWVSFWAGTLLVVGIPALLIKFVYHQRLRDYGLGLPPRDRWRLTGISALLLFVVCAVPFYLGAQDADMQATYPLFRGDLESDAEFFLFELGYLPFFIAIEFIFRGYLLFGLYQFRDTAAPPGIAGVPGPLVFGYYAILISMLSYTAWHLGKPLPELWGTLVWGIAAATVALATRTIWPIIIVHWLLNVFFLDLVVYKGW